MRQALPLVWLLAGVPLAGCAVAAIGTAGAVGITTVQERTMGEALDDANASTQIKTKLLAESTERFGEVDVEVTGGLVLLSGRVMAPEDRTFAEGVAWSSALIRDVANEIKVEPPGGFVANIADEIITGRVRARLIGSSTVKSVNFNIETYNGVVYLMGIARSPEELRAAAEEASVVGGVKQVVSYVRVREPVVRPNTVATDRPATAAPQPLPSPYQPAPDAAYDAKPAFEQETLPELRGASLTPGLL